MSISSIVGMLNNAALLLATGLLFYISGPGRKSGEPFFQQVFNGLTITLICIAAMLNPWKLYPSGLMFDAKSVVLSISGVFFGPAPTIMAILGSSAFRVHIGGIGVWTGLGVIIISGAIGVGWNRFRLRGSHDPSISELFLLGIIVHAAMLLWMFTLPFSVSVYVLSKITIPVLLIYPLATVLPGRLMLNRAACKRNENALRKNEERLELAFELTDGGLFDWDLETNEIYYSPGWKKILGYQGHEIENKLSEWRRLIRPEDAEETRAMMNEVIEGGRERFEKEFRMLHKNGHWVDILARAKAVFDETGKAVRVVGAHFDITEKKRMENSLTKAQRHEE